MRESGAIDVQADVPIPGEREEERDCLVDLVDERDRLGRHRQLTRIDPREVQHVVDEREQMIAGAEDVTDIFTLARRQPFELEHLGEADDRVQRRAQLVAHPREKLAFGPVCRLRLLGVALLGDILEGPRVAFGPGRILAPDRVQHAVLAISRADSEVELKLVLALGIESEPVRDELPIPGVHITKQGITERLVAAEQLVHIP